MTSTESAGQELVHRESGAALVRPIPIPRELQELGIKIGVDAETGTRVVFLPDALRAACNVVNPTTSYTQADPNWTPGISIVKLDVQRDTYNVSGKRGLNKQALETISKAAGVLYTRTERVASDDLQPGERYAYRATAAFRRSDGSIDEVTRERGWNEDVERMKIEDAVKNANDNGTPKFRTEEARAAEFRKRWIAELEFGPAKTESKAINRALRAGLSVPTSLSSADAAKPFLIIGYNFTPDYSDPEIKRALVAVGLNAQAAIYGGREISEDVPELAAGDIPGTATSRAAAEHVDEPESSHLPEDDELSTVDDEQVGRGAVPPTAAGSSPEPVLATEPELAKPLAVPDSVIDNAATTVVKDGKTVAEILALATGPDWIKWALGPGGLEDSDERSAILLVVQHRHPELLEAE